MSIPSNDNVTETINSQSSAIANLENNTSEEGMETMLAPPYSVTSSGDGSQAVKGESKEKKEGESVEMPFDLESVKTAVEAKNALLEIRANGIKVIEVLKGSEDLVGDLGSLELDTDNITAMASKIMSEYNGDEELKAEDKEDLWALAQTFESSFTPSFDEIKDTAKSRYQGIAKFNPLDSKSNEIQNAMHEAYKNSDAGMIKNISDLVEAMEGYNSKAKEMSDLAKEFIPDLSHSKLIKQLDGYSGKMTSFAEKGGEVLEVAQHLNTIYDNVGNAGSDLSGPVKGLESTMFFVDKAINLVDLPGLNFIQGMWNNVYKPMIDVCISGLGKIANLREKGFEDIARARIPSWNEKHIDKDNFPPTYYKSTIERIEGGWTLFYFMWNVMCGEWDRLPNDGAVDYFENNYDRINAGTVSELPYNGIVNWEIDAKELMLWALKEKHHLWAMFYGTVLPYPPKTRN